MEWWAVEVIAVSLLVVIVLVLGPPINEVWQGLRGNPH
jgi:hypothetical protein